jgi:hypothetical protein
MDNPTAIFIASIIGLVMAVEAFFLGLSRGRKVLPDFSPPAPSPVQKEEEVKVTEAVERARKLKEEAEKRIGEERSQALIKMRETIGKDTKYLADDPAALNDYLLRVEKEINKDGG